MTADDAADPRGRTFADRIEAEVRRGKIDSPAAEERAQLELWLAEGVIVLDILSRGQQRHDTQ
jgi:hypothetical protein